MGDEHEGVTSIDDLAEYLGYGPLPPPRDREHLEPEGLASRTMSDDTPQNRADLAYDIARDLAAAGLLLPSDPDDDTADAVTVIRRRTDPEAVDDTAQAVTRYPEHTTGRTCEHCGMPQRGEATVGVSPVCHTAGPYPDCYRLVTVYDEPLGARNTALMIKHMLPAPVKESLERLRDAEAAVERVRALLDQWNRLGRGDGSHGQPLRDALDKSRTDAATEGTDVATEGADE